MNYYKALAKQFNTFQCLFNEGLKEIREDEEYAEELERDRVAEFESTRGTDKPSKYFPQTTN